MHDEDCKFGIRVTNIRGDKWIAYGDGFLFHEGNNDNLRLVSEAFQKSIQQVHDAYTDPERVIHPNNVTDLLPFVDSTAMNNSPLFQMKDGELVRRKDVNNLQDTATKSDWWGTTTVTLLQAGKRKNSALPEA